MLDPDFVAELLRILGPGGMRMGPDMPAGARSDESRTGRHMPAAWLAPATVDELSAVLIACHARHQPVVMQGGLTGLAGGANGAEDQLAVSLARFAGVEAIDPVAGTMLVRAGTILQNAQDAAAAAGLVFPIDLGARGSAQIGGVLATHAGGLRVVRYGTTRSNVLGLEVVLADGRVLSHLNPMVKDNTGYDLTGLMIGSEGTLGVITRAVIRLWPQPAERHTALCALSGAAAALPLLAAARATLRLAAFEAMWPDYFELSEQLCRLKLFDEPAAMVLLIEAEEPLEPFLERAFEDGLIEDALLARSLADARRFWDVRECLPLDDALPGLHNLDVSLPLPQIPAFVSGCRERIHAACPDARALFFGHLGDGNIHVVLHDTSAGPNAIHAMESIVYQAVGALGGSVSAEHGIGRLKREWLPLSRSAAELSVMRSIKQALDPHAILNPGVLFG